MASTLAFGTVRRGTIRSWPDLVDAFDTLGVPSASASTRRDNWGWVFRGHSDSHWRLQSSLERAVMKFALPIPTTDLSIQRQMLKKGLEGQGTKRTVAALEAGLLRQFKRQCHHYTKQLPEPTDTMEWLSLMQHYGAPTRLLDWTYSFYAAVFFALDGASPRGAGDTCCVWAVNADWLRDRFRARHPRLWRIVDRDRNLHKRADTYERVFQARAAFVCPVSPYRLNDRLVIQQGVFLCPGDISQPFVDNLAEMQTMGRGAGSRLRADAGRNVKKIKISLDLGTRIELLRNLHRMNMTPATLYPGLEGFAKSLENRFVFPKLLQSGRQYE